MTDYTWIDGEECNCDALPLCIPCGCGDHDIEHPHLWRKARPIHYRGEHWQHTCLVRRLIGELANCQPERRVLTLESDADDDDVTRLADWMSGWAGAMR